MKKLSAVFVFALALVLPLSLASSAQAETAPAATTGVGSGAGLGVGAATFLGGVSGAQVAYDTSMWHLEGLLGFSSRDTGNGANAPTETDIQVGVRGWYHLHRGLNSDFSLGGGIGFNHFSRSNNMGSGTQTLLEPGAQARVFLTPNFVLFGTIGFSIDFGDGVPDHTTGVSFGGHLVNGFGFTYYFR